ncbi:hypothetical protein BDZ85DRAFT_252652 [Elsinoe ampelina]|uniref:Uncharacterized protein n=1 Tax=Elsinoe ampelina TaxID=302913 RepID=A0A6A6G153_9PEZI|nr:hypothetical protein BDZ85DRAFT_252652 [Elsinoe ampelina]
MLLFISQSRPQVVIAAVTKFTSTRRSPPFPPPPGHKQQEGIITRALDTPPDAVHDQARSIQHSHDAGWAMDQLAWAGQDQTSPLVQSLASLKRALLPSTLALETGWRLLHHADQDRAAHIRHQGGQRIHQQLPRRVHGQNEEQGSEQGVWRPGESSGIHELGYIWCHRGWERSALGDELLLWPESVRFPSAY